MNWGVLSSIFLLSTVKFMYAAIPGSVAGIPFWQTYLANIAGGFLGAVVFYFGAEYFINRSHRKRVEKKKAAIEAGLEYIDKKKFTRTNRFIVKLKRNLGIVGLSFYAPYLLSIPIGSIVVAKFYGKKKITFALITLGILINGVLSSGIPYLF
jgi:membrane protein DedA with SNARE-associated domain